MTSSARRLLLLAAAILSPALARAQAAGENASFVLGQPNMTSNAFNFGGVGSASLGGPNYAYSDGIRLFVSDTGNNRVLIWNTIPASTDVPANVVVGQPNTTSNTPNTGGISSATLNAPEGVFSDGTNLYVADSGNNRVLIFNGIPASNGAGANMVVGQPGMTTSTANYFGVGAASLQAPFGVYSDGTKLYVADTGNNRVLIFNSIPTSPGASANIALGQPDLVTVSTPASPGASTLWHPRAARSNGTNLYVADSGEGRVLIYNGIPTANGASASVAVGVPNLATAGSSATVSALTTAAPWDVATDGVRLFVADPADDRVLIYNQIPTASGAAADEVVGQVNLVSNSSATTAAGLYGPSGVALTSSTLYIVDASNNRAAAYPMPAATSCGSAYAPYFVPRQYPSIQTAANAVSASPPSAGKSACVLVDPGTYSEQVTIQGVALSGSSSTIVVIPSSGTVTVNPPAASQAAFVIANASVTLANLTIAPGSSMSYGVLSSSADTTISNVSVNDASGKIVIAGLQVSSSAVVANSIVTVNHSGTNALVLAGSWSAVSTCSFTNTSDAAVFPYFPGNATVWIDGASSSTITNSFLTNHGGGGALALGGYAPAVATTDDDVISFSTMTNNPNNVNCSAAYADLGAHAALFTNDYFQSLGACGQALQLGSQSAGAFTVSHSTMIATYQAFVLQASSSSVTYSFMSADVSYAAAFSQGQNDSISFSTIAGNGSAAGLVFAGGGDSAVGDLIQGSTAAVIGNLAVSSVLTADQIVGTTGGRPAVWMRGGNGLSLSSSTIVGQAAGQGVFLDAGNSGAIALSNLSIRGSGVAVQIGNQSGASISVSSMSFASLPSGATAFSLTSGILVSSFTGVAFADPNIAFNVGAAGLSPGSNITMRGYSGPRAGPAFAVDPGYVFWDDAVSTVTVPAPGAVVNSFSFLQGTAAAFNASVASVRIGAQNLSTGLYWNGGAFASAAPATSTAAFAGGTWTLNVSSAALTNGAGYQVTSQAFDSLGYAQSAVAMASFTYDNPASTILVPAPGAALSSLPAIQGTAATFAAGAAVSGVTVSIRDLVTGFYWHGNAFAAGNVFNPAMIFPSSWTYSNGIGSAWVSGRSYQIQTQATDSLGATQPGFSSATFLFDGTPPAITVTFPVQGGVYTSIPNITGTSADNVLVATVSVQIQLMASPASCYDPASNAFDLACGPASFIPAQGSTASWSYAAPIPWASGAHYLVTARDVDEAGNQSTASGAFTFQASTALVSGNPGDGGGAAALAPIAAAGCRLITSTVTYTAGVLGISSGGVVALHVPNGWTPPQGSLPAAPGFVQVVSTTAFGVQFNPPQAAGVTLGPNWIVYLASSAISPGQAVQFAYSGFPPAGPAAQLPQPFSVQSQGGPGGNLLALSSAPALSLSPGPAAGLAFSPSATLPLGPLQASPTMQVDVVDACGASTSAPSNLTIALQAQVAGAVDGQAQFYGVSGATLSSVAVATGAFASPAFSFNSSTTGVSLESLLAQATFSGSPSAAMRTVQRLAAPPSLSGVSVDSGTPGAALSATIVPGAASGGRAFINFTPSSPSLGWEVAISSLPSFASKVADFFGAGSPGRTLAWNGQDLLASPAQYLPPGVYYVEINAAQGAAVDTSLTINVAASPSIYGTIAGGPGAIVSVSGPGAGAGNSVAASTSGFFQVFGLRSGTQYNVTAASAGPNALSASASAVAAALGGTSVGTLSFPAQGYLRIAATLPLAAPSELFGGVLAHTADYAQTGSGALHFPQGATGSDNGAQQFGQTASSWTQVALPPGVYQVDASLPGVGVSTSVPGVTVAAGGVTQLPLALQKLANVYGYAVLPAAVSTAVPVAVQAQLKGAAQPSVFGGALVPVGASSAVYSLFGLSPGSWTVTTAAPGYTAASSAVFVAGAADVGTPAGGGFDLPLAARLSQVTGLLTVVGDTTGLGTFSVPVYVDNGASPAVAVTLTPNSNQTSSAFTLTGLSDGSHTIWANLAGYYDDIHPITVAVGQGSAALVLAPSRSNLVLTFKLPGGPHPASDFAGVSYGLVGQSFGQRGPYGTVYPAPIVADWTQYNPSSATVDLGHVTADVTRIQAFYSGNGAYQAAAALVAPGATSYVTLDLSSPSYAVSGTLLLSQSLNLPQNGFTVNVSSIAGLLANTATTGYCLLGSTTAQTASFAHLELLPQNGGSFLGGTLNAADSGGGCSAQLLDMLARPSGGGPHPYWAYLATPDVNGRFSFPAVPPGVYQLRNSPVVDAAGDALPKFSQVVTVTASVSGLVFQLGPGNAISGSVLAPPGVTLNRPMLVDLMDAQGRLVSRAPALFNGAGAAAYLISQVPPGAYTLLARDSAYPKAYAAAPLAVRVSGQDLSGQNLQLLQSGAIKLRLAVQQSVPGTGSPFVLVSPFNANLLPPGLAIKAVSDPWFNGGSGFAGGPAGSTVPAFDANGQFLIDGLLPGSYDLKFLTPTGAAADASVSGIVVSAGGATDVGVVDLAAAARLSGQVLDAATGAPLPGIAVEARPSLRGAGASGRPIRALTDVSGRYALAGLDPSVRFYDLFAAARADFERQGELLAPYQQTPSLDVDVASVSAVNFSLTRAPYSVAGRALAPGGAPLTLPLADGAGPALGPQLGAAILLQKAGAAPVKNPVADVIFATDLGGNFTIPSLASGTYNLTVDALGYAYASRVVTITTASVDVGTIQLSAGASLSGALSNPDGSSPSPSQAAGIIAVGPTGAALIGSLTTDANTAGVTGYQISGFKVGPGYRVLILDSGGNFTSPSEASSLVFASTAPQTLDIVYRAAAPLAAAKASRQGSAFQIEFDLSQPLREKTAADDNLAAILSTSSAAGRLSQLALSADRTKLTAVYAPGVAESSFTLALNGYSAVVNPDSLDPVNPQYPLRSVTTFYVGIDGLGQANVANFQGGNVLISGNAGRVTLPPGAFNVAASSSVQVTLQVAGEPLTGLGASALRPGGRLSALRYRPQAYPTELVAAAAAVPPDVNPLSPFYNIFLPIGVNHALSAPTQLTLSYSSGTDPSTLNVYWFNSAANTYVLQPDITGAAPVIDPVARTMTINVNHFSTFVLFASGQSAIAGASGATDFQAYNFPNPFDLTQKTVTTLRSVAGDGCNPSCSIRGTMVAISVPPGMSGDGKIEIFDVAGTKVKTIEAGNLSGGNFYYQNWDGTNDAGRDVASGVYIGELKVGGQSTFFKMAVVKGSNR